MRAVKRLSIFLALCAVFSSVSAGALEVSAGSAVLLDGDTGRLLYAKNADMPRLIASTTKVMTALVIVEHCDLDAPVTVKRECTLVEGSSMYLKEGEVLTVRELLYGLLLQSGNDAALALADYCAGGVEEFAVLMNRTATDLGLKKSHFVNPHGLNAEGHYASARDLALITAKALQNPAFSEIVASKTARVAGRGLQNHNKLLWLYPGACGVKTGYTIKAGRCLVSAARRDGRLLIAVTLDAPSDWRDHQSMFDLGFGQFTPQPLCEKDERLCELPVIGGSSASVGVHAKTALTVALSESERTRVKTRLILPRFVWAPVMQNAQAGTALFYLDEQLLGGVSLYFGEDVAAAAKQTVFLNGRLT